MKKDHGGGLKKHASDLHINQIMTNQEKREFKELYQLFAEFDTDGNGTISLLEWQQAMKRFGHEATEQQIEEMLMTNNITRKTYITFYEFVTLISNKRKEIMGEEHTELAKAFRLFDKDLDGVLNPFELKAGLERYGETMKIEDLQLLVQLADRDHDGSINFQQFSRIMQLK